MKIQCLSLIWMIVSMVSFSFSLIQDDHSGWGYVTALAMLASLCLLNTVENRSGKYHQQIQIGNFLTVSVAGFLGFCIGKPYLSDNQIWLTWFLITIFLIAAVLNAIFVLVKLFRIHVPKKQ